MIAFSSKLRITFAFISYFGFYVHYEIKMVLTERPSFIYVTNIHTEYCDGQIDHSVYSTKVHNQRIANLQPTYRLPITISCVQKIFGAVKLFST